MTCYAFTENKGIELSLNTREISIAEKTCIRFFAPTSPRHSLFILFSKIARFVSQSPPPNYRLDGRHSGLRGPFTRTDRDFKEPTPTNTQWRQKTMITCSLLRYDRRVKRVSTTTRSRHFGLPTVTSRTCQRSNRVNYRQMKEIARFAWKPTG